MARSSGCARRPASRSIDKAINQALTLGYSHVTGSIDLPTTSNSTGSRRRPVYDPAAAKQLLAEAGYPNGFDAGEYFCNSSYANLAEAVVNNLGEVGIRAQLRPIERAAFIKGYAEKKFKNIIQAGSGAFGNAATRLRDLRRSRAARSSTAAIPTSMNCSPQQAVELDHDKRAAMLHKMQQIVHERSMFAPIWQLAFINGVGPRVGESGFGLIAGYPYTAPYEDTHAQERCNRRGAR